MGGPFRNTPLEDCSMSHPDQALLIQLDDGRQNFGGFSQHDEKGLEVIEAHWLFNAVQTHSGE